MTMNPMVARLTVLLLPLARHSVSAFMPEVRMRDLQGLARLEKPDDKLDTNQWTSLSPTVEYLPVLEQQLHQKQQRLRKLRSEDNDRAIHYYYQDFYNDGGDEGAKFESSNPYRVQPFVEGIGEYDEYQQAWRMLGFMIDCDVTDGSSKEGQSHSRSGDEGVSDDGCARYILWAAYVDLDYEGSGIGEYQYWDRTTQSWNDTSCQYGGRGGDNGDGSRCAKMNCHEDDTSFALLGFFKHRSYDEWMGQLFKHEGVCVWTEEEYAFMKGAKKVWPQGCVDTGTTAPDGETPLYYDIKPTTHGRIVIGLYTDSRCVVEYSSDPTVVESVLGNPFANVQASGDYSAYDFSSDSLAESLARWESAFSVWNTCHPCVAYDLRNVDGSKYLSNDDDGGGRRMGGNYAAKGEVFECYDDAGYTNVNQCMKFSAKTVMNTATFRDLSLAHIQNTLVESPLAGFYDTRENLRKNTWSNVRTYIFLAVTTLCFVGSCIYCVRSKYEGEYDLEGNLKELLLRRRGGGDETKEVGDDKSFAFWRMGKRT